MICRGFDECVLWAVKRNFALVIELRLWRGLRTFPRYPL